MNQIDQFLYDNYFSWKTGVLVFMWQIKIATYVQKTVRVDEKTHKIGNFFTSSIDPSPKSFVFK